MYRKIHHFKVNNLVTFHTFILCSCRFCLAPKLFRDSKMKASLFSFSPRGVSPRVLSPLLSFLLFHLATPSRLPLGLPSVLLSSAVYWSASDTATKRPLAEREQLNRCYCSVSSQSRSEKATPLPCSCFLIPPAPVPISSVRWKLGPPHLLQPGGRGKERGRGRSREQAIFF